MSFKPIFQHYSEPEKSFWTHLPPTLTKLCVPCKKVITNRENDEVIAEIAAKLPRSLTKFTPSLKGFESVIALLPQTLTSIDINAPSGPTPTGMSILRSHFENLTSLTTGPLSLSFLQSLPPSITKISAPLDSASIKREDWPRSLLELNLHDTNSNQQLSSNPAYPISVLPHTLTALTIGDLVHFKHFSLLPPTLLTLRTTTVMVCQDVVFPPNLTHLSLIFCSNMPRSWLSMEMTDENVDSDQFDSSAARLSLNGRKVIECFPFHRLPSSLRNFVANQVIVPSSQLKFLPRRLQLLHIDDIFIDADYDAESASEMEAMRSIFNAGSSEGIREKFDWTPLKRTSTLLLLPRTLVDISFWADAIVDLVDWIHLPPHIEKMWMGPEKGLSGAYLPHLPLDHVHRLKLHFRDLEDDHLKFLPRNADMNITIFNSPKLTRKAALFLPSSHNWGKDLFANPEIEWLYRKLIQERFKHQEDDDPSLFLKLVSWDESLLDMYPHPSDETHAGFQ